MIEQEARQKWCPFAANKLHDNRIDPDMARCIASDCMAWRQTYHVPPGDPYHDPEVDLIGFCGLAGK